MREKIILIIDDDAGIRAMLRQILEREGYKAIEAENAENGLAVLKEGVPVSLVITDVFMPGEMDGQDVALEISTRFSHIPVITISGAGEYPLDMANLFGAKKTFSKPIDKTELLQAVEDLLGRQILLVDDDAGIRKVLRMNLEKAGYKVMEAGNGSEALKIQQKYPADLVITDIIMPEKEGVETILEFRREFPDVKIIAISGGGDLDSELHLGLAKQAGALFTFAKPVKREVLLEAVEELIGC